MPKLSNFTAAINGWDGMSAEEKLAALENVDFPEAVNLSDYVKKTLFDKTASELAAAKKSINDSKPEADKMTEALREATEGRDSALRELNILKNTTEYLKLGYSPEQAKTAAEALISGDMAKVFEIQMQVSADAAKKLKTEYERGLDPRGGSGESTKTDPSYELAMKLAKDRRETNDAAAAAINNFKNTF